MAASLLRYHEKVRELLKCERLPSDYVMQLLDYQRRLKGGFLSTEDRNFVDAVYEWYQQGEEQARRAAGPVSQGGAEHQALAATLQDRLAESEHQLGRARTRIRELEEELAQRIRDHDEATAALQAQLEAAEADVRRYRKHLDAIGAGKTADVEQLDQKFREARRTFARLYHPDHVPADDSDRATRAEVFKEFWAELDRIDRGESDGQA